MSLLVHLRMRSDAAFFEKQWLRLAERSSFATVVKFCNIIGSSLSPSLDLDV